MLVTCPPVRRIGVYNSRAFAMPESKNRDRQPSHSHTQNKMFSRLDRLFILLDTGSTESVRIAAAKQLGEVQKIQPNELDYLLSRIKEYSSRSLWETRIAAGHATKSVIEQVEPWPPQPSQVDIDDKSDVKVQVLLDKFKIDQIVNDFNIEGVTSQCASLLSLDSIETQDNEASGNTSSSKGSHKTGARGRKVIPSKKAVRKAEEEQLLRQRKLINKELGIAMVDSLNLGVKSTDIISNDDLQVNYDETDEPGQMKKLPSDRDDARTIVLQIIRNYEDAIEQLRVAGFIPKTLVKNTDSISPSDKGAQHCREWPLMGITNEYINSLFDPSWEVRHGAAISLREIIRYQGGSGGRWSHLSHLSNDKLNTIWLTDMALKALTVLILDKFGDFLFDQVVAPVRENVAQLLSCCLVKLPKSVRSQVMNLLMKTLDHKDWETRHGGILGLKYSISVFEESVTKKILSESFDSIFKCLADPVDDVSAEAAACLVPVKDYMIETIPDKTPKLVKFLWTHLAELDEITSSTSNIVLLLASLITSSSADLKPEELVESIPKLWPLLNHSSTSVRISVLKALITLLRSQSSTCSCWMPDDLLINTMKLIFQRAILENVDEARQCLGEIWFSLVKINSSNSISERICLLRATSSCLNFWLCLSMQPLTIPLDRGSPFWLNIGPDGKPSDYKPDGNVFIGSYNSTADNTDQQKKSVMKCRLHGSSLLGNLYANIVGDVDDIPESQPIREAQAYLSDMLVYYISSKSALQRMVSSWTAESWAKNRFASQPLQDPKSDLFAPKGLIAQLSKAIQENTLCYDELAPNFTELQQVARDFVAAATDIKIDIPFYKASERRAIYQLNQIQHLCDMDLDDEVNLKKLNSTRIKERSQAITDSESLVALSSKQTNLRTVYKAANLSQRNLSISVLSSLSCALISWHHIMWPDLSILIKPLLESLEHELDENLQDRSIEYLDLLIHSLLEDVDKNSSVIDNVISKLKLLLNRRIPKSVQDSPSDEAPKIIFLGNLQRQAQMTKAFRRQSTVSNSSSVKRPFSMVTSSEIESNDSQEACIVANRGSKNLFAKLTSGLGADFGKKLPKLWHFINKDLISAIDAHLDQDRDDEADQGLLERLNILAYLMEHLDHQLRPNLVTIFPHLVLLLKSESAQIRHYATLCIGLVSKLMMGQIIDVLSEKIIPLLDSNSVIERCGAIEAVAQIIDHFKLDWVDYVNLFVIHVLRRMSDQNEQVRLMATHCFGRLLSLMPLNLEKRSIETTTDIGLERDDQRFIEQLLNPKKLDKFDLPFKINVDLRSYQKDGLNWLAFLNRFNLHGILCDEMGLGKTLMTICIVAADHFRGSKSALPAPSIIVCPSTLTEHWLYEIEKFIPADIKASLCASSYTGCLGDRACLRQRISSQDAAQGINSKPINLVVTSYDILRNDIDFFRDIQWNYCVLDEGHIIKNGKTKLSRSIRLLSAKHRLILSGTPIQNNVTELWSLFDFLMPGFLGSERQFNSRYARPILQSREVKCSPRDMEAGALAMESLHRQVLPFILRRLKEDVLDDLPPKILQDYYCELSPLQQKLYEDFTRGRLCKDVTMKSIHELGEKAHDESLARNSNATSHVFQALQYLKNVCNHPKLVLTEKHSQYETVERSLLDEKSSLDDISHSSKLKALKQLLIDCDIGSTNQQATEQGERQAQQHQDLTLQSVVKQHRALVFCQIRSMINIIEDDLLKKHLPNITYLKLDGSIPVNQRHSIVSRFNNDPSIDILLLTTKIGGLGLNLTGADTVIFVEHDWNPTKDLQAMDRAHRIGQKKVVNVYRLITKGTLEEKIMGLQRFKTMVSNTVINQDNTGLSTMNVDQLLDLFEPEEGHMNRDGDSAGVSSSARRGSERKSKQDTFLDLLPELWDQQQYETEYDLTNFVSTLKN